MRRPWIKIEVSTPDKPEICAIATQLRIDPDAVVGKLVRLWAWAELNGAKPNDLSVTKEFLDKVCGRKGFANALLQAGWLLETDGKLSFPKFDRHNGNASKVRGLTARRVAQHRLRKVETNDSSVTKSVRKTKAKRAKMPPEATPADEVISVKNPPNTVVEEEETKNSALSDTATELTPEPLAEPAPPPATEPEPEPEPETPVEAAEAVEEKPKKRRTKAASSEDAQPMLF